MSSDLRLEQATVRLRPRSHFEAIDLGLHWVRRYPGKLYGAWLATALPAALLILVLLWSIPWLATLALWWFKPLFERMPMWLLSRGLFGEMPDVRDAWRARGESMKPGMGALLTWRRLSPARSFVAPVFVLERPAAAERRARELVLLRSASSPAFWLTLLGFHVEQFLVFGGFVLLALLLPQGFASDPLTLLIEHSGWLSWLTFALMFVAMAIMGPVYAAAGFALYINRRVALEGWDIELGFRRLARRVGGQQAQPAASQRSTRASTLAVALLCTGAIVLPAADVAAQSRQEESRQTIDSVLDDEVFGGTETYSCPAFLCESSEDEAEDDEQADLSGLKSFFEGIAAVAEVLMWMLLALVVGWVLWRLRLLDWLGSGSGDTAERVTVVMGMSVDPDSLPADPAKDAWTLWSEGQRRPAASLLYRATLAMLITDHGVRFETGDTEGDCLRKARAVATPQSLGYLRRLTELWQRVAYAHAEPPDDEFKALCSSWSDALRRPIVAGAEVVA